MSGSASGNSRAPWPSTTGDDEQVDLVDEVVVEQPADQGAAAVHLQLTSRLGFQLADGRRDVTGQDQPDDRHPPGTNLGTLTEGLTHQFV
jgi:hypothetical protein